MIEITQNDLNLTYYKILSLHKQGHINSFVDAVCYTDNAERLVFKYDRSMGRKGAWVLITKVNVTFTEDDGPADYSVN